MNISRGGFIYLGLFSINITRVRADLRRHLIRTSVPQSTEIKTLASYPSL